MKAQTDELLGQDADEIVDRAADVGRERLERSPGDVAITGFIGGIEVSLGALAAMAVLGAVLTAAPRVGLYAGLVVAGLVFPVGFLFVVVGRSELFTENFLIPVVAVPGSSSRVWPLLRVWSLAWVSNLAGCAAMAVLISIPHSFGHPILVGYEHYTAYKLAVPAPSLFVSAIFAGLTMTVMTWLLVAVRNPVGKMMVIWAAGYVLFATNMSHVIVSAAIIFVGFTAAHHSALDVARYIGITTFGNLVGGVGLVTLLRLAQAREKERGRTHGQKRRGRPANTG